MHRPRLRSYSDGDFLVAVATEAEQHTACVGLLRVLRTVELLRIVLELLGVGLLRVVKQLHGKVKYQEFTPAQSQALLDLHKEDAASADRIRVPSRRAVPGPPSASPIAPQYV